MIICSGFNVISVKLGNIKFVLYLMVEETMVGKLNTLAQIAIYKRLKEESVSPYHRVPFLGLKICQEQFLVTT
jgi:hypothetical protein